MSRTPPKRPQRACQKEINYSLTTRRAQKEAEVLPDGIEPTELHVSPKPDDLLSVPARAAAIATIDIAAAPATRDRPSRDKSDHDADSCEVTSSDAAANEEDSKAIELDTKIKKILATIQMPSQSDDTYPPGRIVYVYFS